MKKLWSQSDFLKNVSTLMGGTIIAQIIPLIASPLLTRLYNPEDFGVLAAFMSVSTILAVIATGRYEMAIVLPKQSEEAKKLLKLIFQIALAFILFIFLTLPFGEKYFLELIEKPELKGWTYAIPIYILLQALFNTLNYWHTREENYKLIARASASRSIVTVITQIALAFTPFQVLGLIAGRFTGAISNNFLLGKKVWKAFTDKQLTNVKETAKKYIDFPKFSLPAGLLNSLALEMNSIYIAGFFNTKELGFYALTYRILALPIVLIGKSFSQVYLKEASDELNQSGQMIRSFNKVIKSTTPLAIIGFGLLYLIVEWLFVIVFGEDWRTSGQYAKILIPLFAVRLISSTLSVTTSVVQKQKATLWINVALVINLLLIIIITEKFNYSVPEFLQLFTWTNCVLYLVFVAYYYHLAKSKNE